MKDYHFIDVKEGFCVPRVIKLVLMRRRLKEISLEEIGRNIGLMVPKSLAKEYPNSIVSKKGIFEQHFDEKKINDFFKRYNIPLMVKHYYFTNIDKIRKLLGLFKNEDIAVCYDFPTLANLSGKDRHWGHWSLISDFNDNELILFESKSNRKYLKTVSYEEMSKAIKKHGKKKLGGFWIFTKNKSFRKTKRI